MTWQTFVGQRSGGGYVVVHVEFYDHSPDSVRNVEAYPATEDQARRLFGTLGKKIQEGDDDG